MAGTALMIGRYPAMYGKPDPEALDRLVQQTATYFRTREGLLVGNRG